MFDTLLKTAIIGTANGAQVPEIDSNEIILPENISSEEKLLLAAAFYGLQQKASYQAAKYEADFPAACPDETDVYAPLSVCELILRCMSKEQEDSIVVQEILQKIASKKWIVLPHVLPQLLEYGQNRTHLQALISQVCGERGRWLVRYNNIWKYVTVQHNITIDWDTSTHEERLAIFRVLHKNKPSEALALLQQDWGKESLKNKKDFVNAIIEQTQLEDEAMFEAILQQEKESDADLRRKIAEILVQIPDSALLKRIENPVFECIKLKSGFLTLEKLQITLPTNLDVSLKKDGFQQVKAGYENGKQGIFAQLISLFPPHLLTEKFKKTPEELLIMAEKTQISDILVSSWEKAAMLHKDADWLSALITTKMERKIITPELKKMQNMLSSENYSKLTEKIAKKLKDRQLLFFLANREHIWSETETNIALAEMQHAVRKYANTRPWECNEFKDIAKTISIYVKAAWLKPFSDILHQMSVNKEWEKELKSCTNRIDLRIQIAVILG